MNQISTFASPVLGVSKDTADFLLKVIGVLGFAALTGLAAQIAVPLPGTPVPMTLQTLAVTLAAFTLGARLGTVSMVVYIAAAAAGLPMLSKGGSGVTEILGATGGYLIGFVVSQPVMALSARNGKGFGGAKGLISSLVLGSVVILGCGVLWQMMWLKWDFSTALSRGVWPFLPGDVVKSAAAFVLGFGLVPWACKRGW
ncbi:MAG: biotin transporter BioY [Phycisphaerae bacterium]|nr:biotin transporter BioY [Phycisphaerae bacterium]